MYDNPLRFSPLAPDHPVKLFSRCAILFGLLASATACDNSPDPAAREPELTTAVEELVIGSLADGPAAFGRIGGVVADAVGRIYVADLQAGEIRAFSSDGEHLYSFGGRGAGPGELATPCCLAWGPDGALWVRDGGNDRYSVYEVGESAQYLTSRRMAHDDGSYTAPVTFTSTGDLIDVGHRRNDDGDSELVRFISTEGGAAGEAGSLPRASPEELGGHSVAARGGAVTYFLYQPFGARELVTHGRGERWAHALSSSYEITLATKDSAITLIGDARSPALSAEESAAAVRRMESDAERVGVQVARLPYDVPDSKPPLDAIFFDQEGHLWVELSREDGAPRVADVWAIEGTLERRVQWPADVSLALPGWVGENSALGIRRDSLGVEYVVRLSFGE